jgi:hypothetical protein
MRTPFELRNGWMLATLLVAPFMAQADATIANVATPSIHADLGASGAQLELVIGGYLVAYAVLLITGARLGQTHGYKRMFILGILLRQRAGRSCGDRRRRALSAGRRRARIEARGPCRCGHTVCQRPADRGAACARARRGLAELDLALPGGERTRARGLHPHRAPRCGSWRIAAGQPRRARAADNILGSLSCRHRHRHVLRAAVHARAVSPAGPRTEPARVRADALLMGRGIRRRGSAGAPAARATAPVHSARRLRPAGHSLRRDQHQPAPEGTTRHCSSRYSEPADLDWDSSSVQ